MTEQTINELTNFFQQFKMGETKQPAQSNLLFDTATDYFICCHSKSPDKSAL